MGITNSSNEPRLIVRLFFFFFSRYFCVGWVIEYRREPDMSLIRKMMETTRKCFRCITQFAQSRKELPSLRSGCFVDFCDNFGQVDPNRLVTLRKSIVMKRLDCYSDGWPSPFLERTEARHHDVSHFELWLKNNFCRGKGVAYNKDKNLVPSESCIV